MASGYSVTAKFCALNMSLQEKSGTTESKTDFIDRFSSLCCVGMCNFKSALHSEQKLCMLELLAL